MARLQFAGGGKNEKALCNRDGGVLLHCRQCGRRDQRPAVLRRVGVVQAKPAVYNGLPGIYPGPVGAVVIRLQAFSRQQLGVRDQEIQLQPPLILVFNPQHAVLIFIKPGHQNALKARHQRFPLSGCQVLLGERQHTGGVFLGVWRGVNQLTDFFRLALQYGGAVALPVFAQQIIHRSGTTATSSRMELNDHE
jgi:hypothetical protein